MTNRKEGSLVERIIEVVIGGIIIAVFHGLYWSYFALMWLIFRPFKGTLTQTFRLKELSAKRGPIKSVMRLFCMGCGLLSFAATASSIIYLQRLFIDLPVPHPQRLFLHLLVALAGGMFYMMHRWVVTYQNDPRLQKDLSGKLAERAVSKELNRQLIGRRGAKVLHNTLLVFNAGTDDEFSAEVDHLLVTQHQVYIVETKYKSGIITISPTAARWDVAKAGATSTMRNALLQATNTLRVVRKECNLHVEAIPLVVFVGKNALIDNPSNVVQLKELSRTIQSLELDAIHHGVPSIDPDAVISQIQRFVAHDAAAFERHRRRALLAQDKAEMAAAGDAATTT